MENPIAAVHNPISMERKKPLQKSVCYKNQKYITNAEKIKMTPLFTYIHDTIPLIETFRTKKFINPPFNSR